MQSLHCLRATVHLKGDAFCLRTIMVRAGLLLLCQFHHKTYGGIFLHLSPSLPFLWCPSHQTLTKPRTLLMLGLLELFFAFYICRNLWLLCNYGCHIKTPQLLRIKHISVVKFFSRHFRAIMQYLSAMQYLPALNHSCF